MGKERLKPRQLRQLWSGCTTYEDRGPYHRRVDEALCPHDPDSQPTRWRNAMPKYLIEREIPGASSMSAEQLRDISKTSCGVLADMGPEIQWVQSYVAGDKITCVYIAPNDAVVREHAKRGGFPANRVTQIATIIDPTTAEMPARA